MCIFFGGDVFSCNIQVHTFEMLLISRFVIDDIIQRCLPQQVYVQSHMFRTGTLRLTPSTFHISHSTQHLAPHLALRTFQLGSCTLHHVPCLMQPGTLHALWHRTRNVIFDAALHGRVQPRWTADLEAHLLVSHPNGAPGVMGKPREAPPTFEKEPPQVPRIMPFTLRCERTASLSLLLCTRFWRSCVCPFPRISCAVCQFQGSQCGAYPVPRFV